MALIPAKNRAAAEMGRKGGLKGSAVRAARMTPEERAASARRAAAARWAKPPSSHTDMTEVLAPLDGEAMPPSPFAKHKGSVTLGGAPIDVYVLDTGDRVISMRGAVKAITGKDAGNLGEYLSVHGLKDHINKELVLVETYVHEGLRVRRFVVGIKTANHRTELWFQTLHPTDEAQIRRRLRQAKKHNCLIRSHLWE